MDRLDAAVAGAGLVFRLFLVLEVLDVLDVSPRFQGWEDLEVLE